MKVYVWRSQFFPGQLIMETKALFPDRMSGSSEAWVPQPDLGTQKQKPCPVQSKASLAEVPQQRRYLELCLLIRHCSIVTPTSEHSVPPMALVWRERKLFLLILLLGDQIRSQVNPVQYSSFSWLYLPSRVLTSWHFPLTLRWYWIYLVEGLLYLL